MKTLPADPAVRDGIANWYDRDTLSLLEKSPLNCLLVTFSAEMGDDLERRQQALVKAYTAEAHQRNIAILGLVFAGSDAAAVAAAAVDARLDGLVLEGDFPAAFPEKLRQAYLSKNSSAVVIRFTDAATARTSEDCVIAVEGESPNARSLADMGIRAGPSSEPWIQSNVWLVRSFQAGQRRPIWISYQMDRGNAIDYERAVADAAVAGGRWIVALDDGLRLKLRGKESAAMGVWQRIGSSLRFAEEHAEWRTLGAYANLGVILDPANAESDEYLKLVARRQVPYKILLRSELDATSLAGFRAVLATTLARPTEAEKQLLRAFADRGGVVVAGPSLGKGNFVTHEDPDPETVARDLRNVLSLQETGMIAFNVPSVITYASGEGECLLVQLLNYSDSPATAITIRVSGTFKRARLIAPDSEPANLVIDVAGGKTDVTVPNVSLWGAVLLE